MIAPRWSHRSGRNPSITVPRASEPATKTPPQAARIRPKFGSGWNVATATADATSDRSSSASRRVLYLSFSSLRATTSPVVERPTAARKWNGLSRWRLANAAFPNDR